jgi:phosphotransferase system HPr (HPr) family protein
MPDRLLTIANPSGLHARPAAEFVRAASRFACPIGVANLTRDADRTVDAKSILGVLSLGVSSGHEIRLTADGADASVALDALQALIDAGLGEAPGDVEAASSPG